MTIDNLGPDMIAIVLELARYCPPGRVIDKFVYSPWISTDLHHQLRKSNIDTIVITGGEIDVCVLATVLGAIDWGFRVVLVTDAVCSSADETHDATMTIYKNRSAEQVETAPTQRLLEEWEPI